MYADMAHAVKHARTTRNATVCDMSRHPKLDRDRAPLPSAALVAALTTTSAAPLIVATPTLDRSQEQPLVSWVCRDS